MSAVSSNATFGDDSGLTIPELLKKIEEYSIFVRDVLQPQLQTAVEAREKVKRDIEEYEDLTCQLVVLSKRNVQQEGRSMPTEDTNKFHGSLPNQDSPQRPLESLVDLGSDMCYCGAEADDPTTIFIDVGFGFHVEFRLEEALQFISRRIDHLEKKSFAPRADKARDVATHLKSSLLFIDALSKELQSKRRVEAATTDSGGQVKTISWDKHIC